MKKISVAFHCIIALFLFTVSCSKTEDISGKLDGIWTTQWEDILKGDIDDIKVDEAIEFLSENLEGSQGTFRQIFEGEVKFDDWENESWVSYNVLISGTWKVKKKDILELRYDLNNMVVSIGKSSVEADYTDAGISMLFGDWSGALSSALRASDTSKINRRIEKEVSNQLNSFFKEMFHDINKDKKGMTDVVIDGDMMTCDVNHGFFGREQVYDRISKSNNYSVSPSSQSINYSQLPKNSKNNNYGYRIIDDDDVYVEVEEEEETAGDLDDFDWVTQRYVTPDDLDWRSKEALRILRNWIFARHGYKFNSKDLTQYFSQYPWYTPRFDNVNSQLSEIELYNIDLIKKYEDRL